MFKTPFRAALLALVPLPFAFAASAAEVANTNLNVSAIVADSCIVTSTGGLVFATVNTGVASNQTAPGLITVVCTAAKSNVTIKMEGGDNEDGGQRYMKTAAGDDLLPYTVHSDAAHASAVGVNGNLYSGALSAVAPKLISVYGQIPVGNYAAGIYSDTVRVTLNY